MNLERMLDKCQRGQWKVDDLDWSVAPRPMTRAEEEAVVQYFTDMAGLELLAGALFEEQARRAKDPVLRQIFESFVLDEERHSQAAARLARHYNVHHYREYRTNPALVAFKPHFVKAVRYLSPETANIYITGGELILDVALLRSLNDFVHDDMSQKAMDLINQDESRHIAMDFYMCEFYAAEAAACRAEEAPQSARTKLEAMWAFAQVLYYARPFFDDVFFKPMALVDPEGTRVREAMRRLQLLLSRDSMVDRPFVRFGTTLRNLWDDPLTRKLLGPLIVRLSGLDPAFIGTIYSADELTRARKMSLDQMAEEALAAKHAN